jgi:hypothetical protein
MAGFIGEGGTKILTAHARQDYLMRQLQKLNPGCVITITPAEAA